MFAFGFILLLLRRKAPHKNFLVQFSTLQLLIGWDAESWARRSGLSNVTYNVLIVGWLDRATA